MTPSSARNCPTRHEALVLAEHLIGYRPDRLEPFAPAIGGDDSHSFRLWDDGRPLLLKVMERAGFRVHHYRGGMTRRLA